jgi:hypothetical protein
MAAIDDFDAQRPGSGKHPSDGDHRDRVVSLSDVRRDREDQEVVDNTDEAWHDTEAVQTVQETVEQGADADSGIADDADDAPPATSKGKKLAILGAAVVGATGALGVIAMFALSSGPFGGAPAVAQNAPVTVPLQPSNPAPAPIALDPTPENSDMSSPQSSSVTSAGPSDLAFAGSPTPSMSQTLPVSPAPSTPQAPETASNAQRYAAPVNAEVVDRLKQVSNELAVVREELTGIRSRLSALENGARTTKAAQAPREAQRETKPAKSVVAAPAPAVAAPVAKDAEPGLSSEAAAALTRHRQKTDKAEKAEKPMNAAPAPAPAAVAAGRSDLRLHAMRDGRAWVRDATGEVHQVVEGGTLPDGSHVRRIDEERGVIATSSGDIR